MDYKDLSSEKKMFAVDLFVAVIPVINPFDTTGHVVNCGYTDEHQTCDCAKMGERIAEAINKEVIKFFSKNVS